MSAVINSSVEKIEPKNSRVARAKSILLAKDERSKVYIPHDQYIWVRGEIIGESKKGEYDVFIDDEDIPENIIDSLRIYTGKLGALPLQNENLTPEGVDDMVTLNYLHEASILDNLRRRFKHRLPYTYVGNICIAVNPYQWIDNLYSTELKNSHLLNLRHDLKPHVYGTSATAYKGLRDFNKNQSILVSGESGAGKTETVKILMAHLAHISRSKQLGDDIGNNIIIDKVLQSNPLLESFGNAKTGRNDNSSRFGKFTQLQFDSPDQNTSLIGSRCVTYLLEKSRVIIQNDSKERNYHIFYQMLAAPQSVKERLFLSKSVTARDFRFTSSGDIRTNTIEGKTDAERFHQTMEALALIGVDESERKNVQAVLVGILYIGQVTFLGDTEKSNIDPSLEGLFTHLALLLGLDSMSLKQKMTTRTIVVESNTLTVPLSKEQAMDARDALAKDIYFRLFSWLVSVINSSTAVSESSGRPQERTISLLDIFGFEYFVVNRFEQLNINYANEKLQQKFTEDVFATVQAEYKAEGLQWENIPFKDNSDVLELLEGKQGVFASLNEECMVPKGSDMNYISKLGQRQSKHPCFFQTVHMSKEGFGIQHYAGKVTYNVIGFVERNKDTLLSDMRTLMLTSKNDLICKTFTPVDWNNQVLSDSNNFDTESEIGNNSQDMSPAGRFGLSFRNSVANGSSPLSSSKTQSFFKGETVTTKFKSQLNNLMTSISQTNVQYVRCIKPNSIKSSTVYDRSMVVDQLRCAGVIEAIRISRAAYPYRLTHAEFLDRFGVLKPKYRLSRKSGLPLSSLCKGFLDEFASSDSQRKVTVRRISISNKVMPYEVGKTRVYFSSGVLELLELLRTNYLSNAILSIQKSWRCYVVRRLFLKKKRNAILIQSKLRAHQCRCLFLYIKKCIIKLQCFFRQWLSKRLVSKLRKHVNAIRIQSVFRMVKPRRHFYAASRAARKVQRWIKTHQQKAKYKKELAHAKQQANLQFQLESLKQKLQEESVYREQMQRDLEQKLRAEKEDLEIKLREEMQTRVNEEKAKLAERQLKPKVEAVDAMALRDQIRKEMELSLAAERESLEQKLREEMRIELEAKKAQLEREKPALVLRQDDHAILEKDSPMSSASVTPTASARQSIVRRGSDGSGVTSLESGATTLDFYGINPMANISQSSDASSLQADLKKMKKKIEFLTKENMALKSMVRSDGDFGPGLRNDKEIRDRANMQTTVNSLSVDLERLNSIISQLKEEKTQMLATWSQLAAELELSNAQRDEFSRRLEHEKNENRERNRMTLLYLASKRVDPNIVQELKGLFPTTDIVHSVDNSPYPTVDKKKIASRRNHQKFTDFDDNESLISSVSTHRERAPVHNISDDFSSLDALGRHIKSKNRTSAKPNADLSTLHEESDSQHSNSNSNSRLSAEVLKSHQKEHSEFKERKTFARHRDSLLTVHTESIKLNTVSSSDTPPRTPTSPVAPTTKTPNPESTPSASAITPMANITTPTAEEIINQTANLFNSWIPGLFSSPQG